ncbi:MAG: hypothetical protein IPM85_00615 [Chitinophagaceae bacterium]|nr:hypothetical protein [Chitinophagaceae bacterium]
MLFITQGLLFLWAGITGKLVFQFKMTAQGIACILLVFFALVVYPLLGVLQSHRYPDAPGFGLPCPSTIFTFGLFLWTVRKPPVMLLIIPFLWSVVGFSASFSLGVKEDIGLLAAGLVTAAFMFTSKKISKTVV